MSQIEKILGIPDNDALDKAMEILNVGGENIKTKNINKAIEILDKSAQKSGINILPEIEDDNPNKDIFDDETGMDINVIENNTPTHLDCSDSLITDIKFEKEMDDVACKAMRSYEELLNFSLNAGSGQAMGVVAQTASKFLDTALEARKEKEKLKLNLLRLKIEERKVALAEKKSFIDGEAETEIDNDTGKIKFSPKDREEILK